MDSFRLEGGLKAVRERKGLILSLTLAKAKKRPLIVSWVIAVIYTISFTRDSHIMVHFPNMYGLPADVLYG